MKALFRLWPYVRPFKANLVVVVITGAVLSATTGSLAFLVKHMFDALENKNADIVYTLPFIIIAVFLVHGLARYFHTFLLKYSMDQIIARLRQDLQAKFLKLNLTYHYNYRTGGAGLLSQTLNDVNIIIQGLVIMTDLIREPLTVVVLIGTMFYLDWQLALFSILFLPLLLGVLRLVTKGLKKHSGKQLEQLEDLSGSFKETLDGIRVIQSFGLEKRMKEQLKDITDRYVRTRKSIYRREESSGPLSELVGAVIFSGIALYAGHNIIQGTSGIGDFLGFLTATYSLQPSIKKLQSGYVRLQQCVVATDRILDTLSNSNEVVEAAEPLEFPKDWQCIEFQNVTFKYKDNIILDRLNLRIQRGETIALVGESGSGKSTIINLLMRFFEPNEGKILIGDTPIEQFALKDLRKEIAMVSQDVFLFNESVRENIRYGDIEANKDVESSAKSANAHDFIMRLNSGYDTKVGEKGSLLSGGEKQRISIARAFYKDAPILILDEATSALDSVSEMEVQKGLDKLMQGRTAIVIAHRLSTIMNADQILVLQNGQIVEQGRHDQLLSKNGEYSKYFRLQSNL